MHITNCDSQSIGASGEQRHAIDEGKRTEVRVLLQKAREIGARFEEHIEDCIGRVQRDHVLISARMHKNIEAGKESVDCFMRDHMEIVHLQNPEQAQDTIEKFRSHILQLKDSDGMALRYPNLEKAKAAATLALQHDARPGMP